jgi:hypothetical protein
MVVQNIDFKIKNYLEKRIVANITGEFIKGLLVDRAIGYLDCMVDLGYINENDHKDYMLHLYEKIGERFTDSG